ncbi:DUF3263 domain-containing protein [Micrococcus sp. NPDC078436]|uniref:DUF3263 domain-containing protein n=1 Tax=Micrococcus sp. NPDC078436 TaxID=3154960 RepID=UPI00344EB6BB
MTTTTEAPASAQPGLSVRDHMALQLWGRRWRYGAARDGEARRLLGLSGTALALRVARLAEDPVAIAAYPVLTRRVRESRGTRERVVRAVA